MKLTDMSERLLLVELVKLMRKNVKQGEWVMERIKERINEDSKKSFQQKEKELRLLIQSPKYWKEQDPETVKRVEEGFKSLYGF